MHAVCISHLRHAVGVQEQPTFCALWQVSTSCVAPRNDTLRPGSSLSRLASKWKAVAVPPPPERVAPLLFSIISMPQKSAVIMQTFSLGAEGMRLTLAWPVVLEANRICAQISRTVAESLKAPVC